VLHQSSAFVEEDLELKVITKSTDTRHLDTKLSIFLQPRENDDCELSNTTLSSQLTVVKAEATISTYDETSHNLLRDIPLGILSAGDSVERHIRLKSFKPGTRTIEFALHTTPQQSSSPTLTLPSDDRHYDNLSGEVTQTVVIPILAPFSCSSTVTYRRRDIVGEGSASVASLITIPGPRNVWVESVDLVETVCLSLSHNPAANSG